MIARRKLRWLFATLGLACAVLAFCLATIAIARPGGGSTYSGGGGHSSSSSGGGYSSGRSSSGGGFSSSSGYDRSDSSSGNSWALAELLFYLVRGIFAYPVVGLPILAIVVGFVLLSAYRQHKNKDWDSGPPVQLHHSTDLADIRRFDPAFSAVVFEDFAFRLFSTAQRARRSADELATVAPYVGPDARDELAQRPPVGVPVEQAIVGAMRTYRVELPDAATTADGKPNRMRVGIEYEANVATAQHTYYSVELWLFGRDATVHSKPPGASRKFACPNCGAPWDAARTGTQVCGSCGQVVDNGRFDWVVERIELASNHERPPTLTSEVPERGTDLPTYRDPDVDAIWQQLTREDPQLTEPALFARLAMIYSELNAAWSNNELRPVRGLVSDGLYDYLQYWVEAHKRQGLRNVMADMHITHATLAKVARDAYFTAITVRIWGTGKDYVIREPSGEHVRGSRSRDRAYSEYWTLIRTANRSGPAVATMACSNCGAPLQIAASGECEHCGAHVTGGEFDWTLSKIEQDDSYRG